MNRTVHRPISRFAEDVVHSTEDEMPRISLDAMLLQAHLGANETASIEQLARELFCEKGQSPTPIDLFRTKRAASCLANLKHVEAIPNIRAMTHVKSLTTPGTQAAAAMNMMIRHCAKTDEAQVLDTIVPAGTVIPHSPIVEEVLQEQKARVAASAWDYPKAGQPML